MTGVHQAADLLDGAPALRALRPPARLAVFGDPIAQSKSPVFQNAALRACAIDAQYVRLHVTPADLATSLQALSDADFLGANLTYPHKTASVRSLDHLDPAATAIGAVNTIAVREGKLIGYNTDGAGFVRAIREDFTADVRDLRIMVLGAGGGAGRSIAVQCALDGCERLVLVNRSVEKIQMLATEMESYFPARSHLSHGARLVAIPHDSAAILAELRRVDLVVNATSVGMNPGDPVLIAESHLSSNLMVYDAVYAGGKSRLVADAERAGARAANGLSMLLHQGALAFETWFGRPAPLDVMRAALQGA